MLWIAAGIGAIAGLAVGWVVRGARNNSGETRIDWKTRLAARDDDLLEARKQLAVAAAEAQGAVARAHAAGTEAVELRAELGILRENAYERDREIERLEELVIELKAGSGEPDSELVATRIRLTEVETELASMGGKGALDGTDPIAELAEAREHIAELEELLEQASAETPSAQTDGRLEVLEAELATLQSQQCADPNAHRAEATIGFFEPAFDDEDIDDEAPLAPVVALRPLGDGSDPDDEASVPALVTDAPLFDEALYDDEPTAVVDDPEEAPEAADESAEPTRAEAASEDPDDLTEIKGIGPQIGSMLNQMGILSFRDLAALADLEADELSSMFNGLASRLRKGNWIDAARELHQAKYGEVV
jgi:predicted flap endonuclease-1-like 5' DNA nuclease